MTTPDIAIFRAPDENGEKTFCQVAIVDGQVQTTGQLFSLPEDAVDDSYNLMGFEHIVLAKSVDGGSIDLARYAIDDLDGSPGRVWEYENVAECITAVYEAYLKTLEPQ